LGFGGVRRCVISGAGTWALEKFDARLQTFAPEGHAA
jgi:hypothetical protein